MTPEGTEEWGPVLWGKLSRGRQETLSLQEGSGPFQGRRGGIWLLQTWAGWKPGTSGSANAPANLWGPGTVPGLLGHSATCSAGSPRGLSPPILRGPS